jgi:two-component system LytT family sensor kinase
VSEHSRGRGERWAVIRQDLLTGLVFWGVIDLFFFSRMYIQLAAGARATFTWREILGPHLLETVADIVLWTVYTPLILHLVRRYPLGRTLRPWLVHLGASIPLAVVSSLVGWAVVTYTWPIENPDMGEWVARNVHNNVLVYFLGVAVALAIDFYRSARDRELEASKLETQLARAHLQALEMQIQPHFLFNTLNSISELVHEDPRAADRTITRLGDLLRMAIDREAGQEVPLRRELDFVGAYLDIERTRFHDRLSVEVSVDPEALDALVPNLVLQPLVENAVRHGVGPRARAGHITVTACRDGGLLRLVVRDDGRGLSPRMRERVGIGNTRTRLRQLYGDAHRFELVDAPEGGVIAMVEIPFRPSSEGEIVERAAAPRLAEAR